jgi:hypothetical protein
VKYVIDSVEKVPCVECGKPVSAKLADKRHGRCLRCDLKRNPFFVLYNGLVARVHGPGGSFESLSESEKLYYAIELFQGGVNNGGFHQFFFNSSGSYYDFIVDGLSHLNEVESLMLLRQAKEIVFPGVPVPKDTETRRDEMPLVDPQAARPKWAERLDELDRQFYSIPDTLTPKLQAFARERQLVPAEDHPGCSESRATRAC